MNTRESVNVVQKIIKKLIIAYASFNFSLNKIKSNT